jgi:ABC-type branched-subunit amino acid transport system substrate-binding protein
MAETGWWAATGTINALQMKDIYVDWFNEQGGFVVNGETYHLEIINEDTKSTLDGVAAACNKLIHEDGVDYIVGPDGFFTPAASAVTNPAEVVGITGWCTNVPGEVDGSTPYSFSTSSGSVASSLASIIAMRQPIQTLRMSPS